jgi:hypothetical protein
VNFLIDAQLPRRLARKLRELGHDALHTLDLPGGNRTPDPEINAVAQQLGSLREADGAGLVAGRRRDRVGPHPPAPSPGPPSTPSPGEGETY